MPNTGKIYESGPQAVRLFSLSVIGEANQSAAYNFDHNTFVQEGCARFLVRGKGEAEWRTLCDAGPGQVILIRAGVEHRVEALSPIPSSDPRYPVVQQIWQIMRDAGLTLGDLASKTRYACVFAHRDGPGGVVVQSFNGQYRAYE